MLWTHLICSNRPHKSLCCCVLAIRHSDRKRLVVVYDMDCPFRDPSDVRWTDAKTGSPKSKCRLQSSIQFWSMFINSTFYCIHLVDQRPNHNICRSIHASRTWMARCIDIVRCIGWWIRWHPRRHQDQWATDGSSSRSLRSNSCAKELQHPPTIVDNQEDGWRLRSTEHHPLTDRASDGSEMELLSRPAFDHDDMDRHNHLVCVDAVGEWWMVLVGGGRGGGAIAMVFACFHRDNKSVPKFWYVLNGFLSKKWRAIDNFVRLT